MMCPDGPAMNKSISRPIEWVVVLHRDRRFDARVRVVAFVLEVPPFVLEDAVPCLQRLFRLFSRVCQYELRMRASLARQQKLYLFEVVGVNVHVTTAPDKVPHLQSTLLRHHVGKQRVASDVERNTQKQVGASLGQLARQPAFADVELEECMARRKRHVGKLGHVPGGHDKPARVWIANDLLDHVRDLVDALAVWPLPAAPLCTIHWSELAGFFVGPLVPDVHTLLDERADVGFSSKHPQQLCFDPFGEYLLALDEREILPQGECHLRAEHTQRASASSICLFDAVFEHVLKQIFVRRFNIQFFLLRTRRAKYTPP